MNPFRIWLHAIRPRTLLLALATISLGTALGKFYGSFRPSVFALTLVTALLLQIISNFANDLGDFLSGADSTRVGQIRTVQSGWISKGAMRSALIVTIFLACGSGCCMLWYAFGKSHVLVSIGYAALGLIAVGAALAYTLGKNPYGYRGMGDVAVFFFFGIVGVCGAGYLQKHFFVWQSLLPAIAMGALSTGVLNINNMRDIETDRAAGKKTIVVHLGARRSRMYHVLLMGIAFCATGMFVAIAGLSLIRVVSFLSPVLLAFVLLSIRIVRTKDPSALDPFLKVHSFFTLLYALGLGGLLWLH